MAFFKQIAVIAAIFFMISCVIHTPNDYFNTAVLNMNELSDIAGCRQIKGLLATSDPVIYDDANNPRAATYEEYVKWITVGRCEENLQNINELPETEETKAMLDASKALFEKALYIYKTEMPKIAALKDKGASQEEIDAACKAFDQQYGAELEVLYNNLFDLGMKYAKDNNLDVSTF